MNRPMPDAAAVAHSRRVQDAVVAAIESEGCILSSQNSGAVLLRANLTRDELAPLILQLQERGQVEASGDASIRLLSQNCI